ncbi:MAG: hypothetical protein ROO73_02110 [Roseivirga sp.]
MKNIRWFCILILLLQAGCEGCKQATGDHVPSSYGATIKSRGPVVNTGSINNVPVMGVPVKVEKYIPGKAMGILGVALVPQEKSIDGAFAQIQAQSVGTPGGEGGNPTIPFHTIYKLPEEAGYVFYDRTLDKEVLATNPEDLTIYVSSLKEPLPPSVYHVVPFIKESIRVNSPVFHPREGADHQVAEATAGPQVTLDENSVQAPEQVQQPGGKIDIALTMEGCASGVEGPMQAGFLFIPEDEDPAATRSVVDIIGKVIFRDTDNGEKDLLVTPVQEFAELQQKANKGIVFYRHGVLNSDGKIEMAKKEDRTGALRKGTTYIVHAVLVKDGHYTVSKEKAKVTIPQVEVELKMSSVDNLKLTVIYDPAPVVAATAAGGGFDAVWMAARDAVQKYQPTNPSYTIQRFELDVSGTIDQKNTTNPTIGFVFAPEGTAVADVQAAVENPMSAAVGWQKHTNGCIVWTEKNTDAANDKFVSASCNFVPTPVSGPGSNDTPKLGQTYNVYCWLHNRNSSGDWLKPVILSDAQQLALPAWKGVVKVDTNISASGTRTEGRDNFFKVKNALWASSNITEGDYEKYLVFSKRQDALTEDQMGAPLDQVQSGGGSWRYSSGRLLLSDEPVRFHDKNSAEEQVVQARVDRHLKKEQDYYVNMLVRKDNIFFLILNDRQYCTMGLDNTSNLEVFYANGKGYNVVEMIAPDGTFSHLKVVLADPAEHRRNPPHGDEITEVAIVSEVARKFYHKADLQDDGGEGSRMIRKFGQLNGDGLYVAPPPP